MHILDFVQDLYGADLRVQFVQRLRSERKFDGPGNWWPRSPATATWPGPFWPLPGPALRPDAMRLREYLNAIIRSASMRWMGLAVIVGLVSGLCAVGFFTAVEYGQHLLLHGLAGQPMPAPAGESLFHMPAGPPRPWLIPLLTTAVGLGTGWLVARFIPETIGGGTDGTDP